MPFDPDAYLADSAPAATATASKPTSFDPDAYLKEQAPEAAPAAPTEAQPKAGGFDPDAYLAATEPYQNPEFKAAPTTSLLARAGAALRESPALTGLLGETQNQTWKRRQKQELLRRDLPQLASAIENDPRQSERENLMRKGTVRNVIEGSPSSDIALRAGLPIIATTAAAPLTPLGMAGVGAASGFVSEALVQGRQWLRGERNQPAYGALGVNTALNAIPMGGQMLTTVPKIIATRAVQQGLINATAAGIESKIDTGQVNWDQVKQSGALGALFGTVFGTIEARAARTIAVNAMRSTPEFAGFSGSDNELIRAVHARLAAEEAAAREAAMRNVTPKPTPLSEQLPAPKTELTSRAIAPEIKGQLTEVGGAPGSLVVAPPTVVPAAPKVLHPMPEGTEIVPMGNRFPVIEGYGSPIPHWQIRLPGEDRPRVLTAEALANEGWQVPLESNESASSEQVQPVSPEAYRPAEAPLATVNAAAPAEPAALRGVSRVASPMAGSPELADNTPVFKKKGRRLAFGPSSSENVDLIDAIQDLGGVPNQPDGEKGRGGEWNLHRETFQGRLKSLLKPRTQVRDKVDVMATAAKLYPHAPSSPEAIKHARQIARSHELSAPKREAEGKIDVWIKDELADTYPQFNYLATEKPDVFYQALHEALAERDRMKRTNQIEMQHADFQASALDGTGRSGKARAEIIPIPQVVVGDEFKIKRSDCEVIDKDPLTGDITVQDGPKYGTQILPGDADLHADKGSFKPAFDHSAANAEMLATGDEALAANASDPVAPLGIADEVDPEAVMPTPAAGGDLFNTADTFNLAGQEGTDFAGHMDERAAIAAAKAAQARAQRAIDFSSDADSLVNDGEVAQYIANNGTSAGKQADAATSLGALARVAADTQLDLFGYAVPDAGGGTGRSGKVGDNDPASAVQRAAAAAALTDPTNPAKLGAAFGDGNRISSIIPALIRDHTLGWDIRGAVIKSARDLATLCQVLRTPYVETMKIAFLNDADQVVHSEILSVGSATSSPVHSMMVTRALQKVKSKAPGRRIIVSHNHPSGDPEPSTADISMTRMLNNVCNEAGFELVDHVVTNGDTFYSFREMGLITPKESRAGRDKPTATGNEAGGAQALGERASWEVVTREELPKIKEASDLAPIIGALRQVDATAVHIVYVNRKNAIMGLERLSKFPTDATALRTLKRAVFEGIGREGATGFFLGLPEGMQQARVMGITHTIRDFAKTAGVNLLDVNHPVFSGGSAREVGIVEPAAKYNPRNSVQEPGADYMPPIPNGQPSARHSSGRMLVTLERMLPGQIDIPTVMEGLREVLRVLGHAAPIRTGHFQHKASGVFFGGPNVIRLNSADNVPTAAHEVGHALAQQVWGSTKSKLLMASMKANPQRAVIIRELVAMGRALYGNRKPSCGYTSEGFAELSRLWLTTEDAARIAPKATQWLEQVVIGGNPNLRPAMQAARDKIDLWRGQGAQARVNAQTKSIPAALVAQAKDVAAKFTKRGLVERFDPFREMSQAFMAVSGHRLPAHQDPYLIATAKRQSAGAVMQNMVLHGMVDVWGRPTGGPSLRETVDLIKPQNAQLFRTYGHARMAVEAWKEGKNPGMAIEDALYLRNTLEKQHPEFVAAAQKRHEWWDALLQYKRDASPAMNGKLIDAIRAKKRFYFGPLNRDLTAKESRTSSVASGGGSGLHRFSGSGLPVKQIDQQSLVVAQGIIAGAHRDMIMDAVINMAKHPGMGFIVEQLPRSRVMEQVPIAKIRDRLEAMGLDTSDIAADEMIEYLSLADTPVGSDPIIVRQTANGPEWYQVPAAVLDMLEGVQNPERLGWAFELLIGAPNRLLKLGTTGLRPAFALSNTIKDLSTYLVQSVTGNPASNLAAWVSAQANLLRVVLGGKPSELHAIYDQLGITGANFLGGDIQHARREANALYRGKRMRVVMNPIETLRELIGFTEGGPRMAEMGQLLREMGWKPGDRLTPEQAIAATVAAKRVTVDFSASGADWETVRRSIPFFGPAVQGLRSGARAFSNEKDFKRTSGAVIKTMLSIVSMLTIPALFNWWRNKDEDWYNQLPWRERWNYLNVERGGTVYQIPLPQEFGAAFVSLPVAALESWYKKDKAAVQTALGHLFDVVNPLDWPALVKAGKEQWQNRIDFFDRPIVPRGEIDLMPGAQRGPYTSWLGKALGDTFPETISPRRVDAAVREVFGGAGSDAVDAPAAFMRALGLKNQEKARASELSDVPVIGRIARRGGTFTANNQYLIDFWDDYARYSAWETSNTRALKAGDKPVLPMGFIEQGYAMRLKLARPAVQMLLEVAARTPDTTKRQECYRQAANFARSFTASRPRENKDKPNENSAR